MDVTSFVFGMLAIISVILLTGLVVGIVKIVKNGKRIVQLESFLDDFQRDLEERFDDVYEGVGKLQSYTDSRFDKAK